MRGISRFYAPLLQKAIKLRVAVVAAAVLVVLSGLLATRLGTEFIPIWMKVTSPCTRCAFPERV